jgi:molybdopterin converting factor small subunit
MTIVVKLFALHAQQVGTGKLSLDLPDDSTVADALQHLSTKFPNLFPQNRLPAVAVNLAYATAKTSLHDGDELALIPAVSGGCDAAR